MAKFIKVTQDYRKVRGAMRQSEDATVVNVESIEYVTDDSPVEDEKTTVHLKTGRKITFVAETPEEVLALIEEAQGPSDLNGMLGEALAELDPSDVLKMIKEGP